MTVSACPKKFEEMREDSLGMTLIEVLNKAG
jgi:hypothetical protein